MSRWLEKDQEIIEKKMICLGASVMRLLSDYVVCYITLECLPGYIKLGVQVFRCKCQILFTI